MTDTKNAPTICCLVHRQAAKKFHCAAVTFHLRRCRLLFCHRRRRPELPPLQSCRPKLPARQSCPRLCFRPAPIVTPDPGASPSCCPALPSASHPGIRAGPAPNPGAHAASVSIRGARADPASNPNARAAPSCCCLPEPPLASSDCSSLCRL
jgi:hypothetical protein